MISLITEIQNDIKKGRIFFCGFPKLFFFTFTCKKLTHIITHRILILFNLFLSAHKPGLYLIYLFNLLILHKCTLNKVNHFYLIPQVCFKFRTSLTFAYAEFKFAECQKNVTFHACQNNVRIHINLKCHNCGTLPDIRDYL